MLSSHLHWGLIQKSGNSCCLSSAHFVVTFSAGTALRATLFCKISAVKSGKAIIKQLCLTPFHHSDFGCVN
ncbi:unnamed protein product [Schistosoma guineensis]|nr:unnamed protein product [Schistosoma guineensis]